MSLCIRKRAKCRKSRQIFQLQGPSHCKRFIVFPLSRHDRNPNIACTLEACLQTVPKNQEHQQESLERHVRSHDSKVQTTSGRGHASTSGSSKTSLSWDDNNMPSLIFRGPRKTASKNLQIPKKHAVFEVFDHSIQIGDSPQLTHQNTAPWGLGIH